MIICWFSCGITSAVACKLTVDKFGADACMLVYIEIDSAHEDNERFIRECEEWIGAKIVRIRSAKFRDQFDVIERRRYINGPTGALCTSELKKQVRFAYQKVTAFTAQVFGFEFRRKEVNRALRFSEQYPDALPIYPLIEAKMTKEDCARMLRGAGIALPMMYRLGYSNNNCIGCVKGGMGYWNRIRVDFPDVFARMSKAEESVGRSCIKDQPLRTLSPSAGRYATLELPDCGVFCEVEGAEVEHPGLFALMGVV